MLETSRPRPSRAPLGAVPAALPVAAAIGVFGVIYGAAAEPLLGAPLTVASSVLVFSGAAQFAMISLLATGAETVAVLGAVSVLALRHLPLGAVLRPRLTVGRPRRALLSLFLLDETTGLALARPEPPERALVVGGVLAYCAWVAGTAAGVAGADLAAAASLADALFPVLFVGLAALTAQDGRDRRLALAAGVVGGVLLLAWPQAGAGGAIVVAVLVAVVGSDR